MVLPVEIGQRISLQQRFKSRLAAGKRIMTESDYLATHA